jgi:UTP--glucose-1-phosphate uridylyltransferase
MKSQFIRKAIVPAAGLGTRLRPLTIAIPKELLPLGRKPVLQYVVEELISAGIEQILFVVSPAKELIRRYFEDGSGFDVQCEYAIQPQMLGLGDAVLHGEHWAAGENFVVAFGDCIITAPESLPLSRLLQVHSSHASDATVLAERIPRQMSHKYGILDPGANSIDAPFKMQDIVEKPSPENAPSDLAVAARWALTPRIFPYIKQASTFASGEVNLTDPVRQMIREGAAAWGVPLEAGEARCDIGGWETYLKACARAAAGDFEFGDSIRESICNNQEQP